MVLRWDHNRHPSHSGDVRGCDCRGGQRWWGWGRRGVGQRERLGLGQLGVALRLRDGAAVGFRRHGVPYGEGAVVVVAVVCRGGGSVLAGRPVACHAARGRDDGGGVRGRPLGVVLQLVVVVVVVVRQVLMARAGGNGGHCAVFGDDVRTHAALGPGHAFRSLSVLLDLIGHVVFAVLSPSQQEKHREEKQEDEANHRAHYSPDNHPHIGR